MRLQIAFLFPKLSREEEMGMMEKTERTERAPTPEEVNYQGNAICHSSTIFSRRPLTNHCVQVHGYERHPLPWDRSAAHCLA